MTPMEQANAAVRIAARPVEQTMRPTPAERTEAGWLVALVGTGCLLMFLALLLVLA